jgi:hypothetical protein
MSRAPETQEHLLFGMNFFITPYDRDEFSEIPYMTDIKRRPKKGVGRKMHMGVGKGREDTVTFHIYPVLNSPIRIRYGSANEHNSATVFNEDVEYPVIIFAGYKNTVFKYLHDVPG